MKLRAATMTTQQIITQHNELVIKICNLEREIIKMQDKNLQNKAIKECIRLKTELEEFKKTNWEATHEL